MSQRITRYLTLPALLFAFVLASCERAGGPESLLAPQFEEVASTLTPVTGDDGAGYGGSVTIGSYGGTFPISGGHVLVVPAGAVSGYVKFKAELHADIIGVKLTATSLNSSVENDVGSAGFAKPLSLTIDYSKANRPVDPSRLTVAYEATDGLQASASSVDTRKKKVTTQVGHFSGYIIAD